MLLILKCIRPDRILSGGTKFVDAVFKTSFLSLPDLDLKAIVKNEVKSVNPVAFCSIPGYDASYRAESLAAELKVKMVSVAMGSAEGFGLAETAIKHAAKKGTWVLLKNVHLAPGWLAQLSKKLYALKADPGFRLCLTMETNPKVPSSLITQSRVLMFEPSPGIKANMLETLNSIGATQAGKAPGERARLYFLLAWLHSVIQERLRYAPLGWTKVYEFNDSDHGMGVMTVDGWLDGVASGKSNIDPKSIPWDALRILIRETVYGGKIDSAFDQTVLDSFVNALFTPACFEPGFELVKGGESEGLVIPEGTKMSHFIEWVRKLPDNQPPHWLGLPRNAENLLKGSRGRDMLSKVRKMSSLSGEDEVVLDSDAAVADKNTSALPAWMRSLSASIGRWIEILPSSVSSLGEVDKESKSPLYRFFERENEIATGLLRTVCKDLSNLDLVCKGEMKQTNNLRSLIGSLTKGTWFII
jgi:dynein heavy chain 1